MRARGQGPLAAFVALALVAGGVALNRLGPRPEPAAVAGTAPSGMWVCPNGGGGGWNTTLYLANPGATTSTVRVTSLSDGAPHELAPISVAPGVEVAVAVPSSSAGAATTVEWFGGWVGAGWVSTAGGSARGVAAEPCAAPAGTWYAPDGSTVQGQQTTYLVVANPSAADAVFSVALFTPDRPPIRESKWTNLVLPGSRSIALRLNLFAANEAAVSAEIDVSSGRVAVSSLVLSSAGGVSSALGQTSLGTSALLPVAGGAGQTELVLMAPAHDDAAFGATLVSQHPVQPAGGLAEVTQPGQSARSYPVIVTGPSSVDVRTNGAPMAAALRSQGSPDTGATGGALRATSGWIVLPSVVGDRPQPGLVLVNPGSQAVQVTLHLLGTGATVTPADVTVTVGPSSTATAPAGFLEAAPTAAVVARSDGGAFVALGASTSPTADGYALSVGVPLPSSG